MRSLTAEFRAALYAQETDQVFLPLLTIEHPNLDEPLRYVANTQAVTSQGRLFTPYPFDVRMPDDVPDGALRAQLTIDNVDRSITQLIRAMAEPPTITIELVRAAAPDSLEVRVPTCTLRNVAATAFAITGDLVIQDILSEPCPRWTFSPTDFPAVFTG